MLTTHNNLVSFDGSGTEPSDYLVLIQADWPTSPIAEKSQLFRSLSEKWCTKTAGLPRVADKLKHEAYQIIIGWGEDALPHILADLRDSDEPKHWFEALHQITGANPVPVEHRGDLKKMAEAWIEWGRDLQKVH